MGARPVVSVEGIMADKAFDWDTEYQNWCRQTMKFLDDSGMPYPHGLAEDLANLWDRGFEPQEAAMAIVERG